MKLTSLPQKFGFFFFALLLSISIPSLQADEFQVQQVEVKKVEAPTSAPTAVPASAIPTLSSTPIPIAGATITGETSDTSTPLRSAEDIAPADKSGAPIADARERESQNVEALSLVDAITLTLRNNPQREAAIAALQAANARVGTAKANGGPTVSLTGSLGYNRYYGGGATTTQLGDTSGGTTGGTTTSTFSIATAQNTQSLGVDANVPIYGGSVKADKRAAQAAARSEAALTLQVEQQLVQSTITAYLDVLRNEQLLQVAKTNLDVSREQRRVTGERYSVGAGARLDVLSANTELASARQSVISASSTLAQSKTALNVLLGRSPEMPVRLMEVSALTPQIPLGPDANSTDSAPTANTSAQLRDIAQQENPTLASNRALIEQALANIDVAKAAKALVFPTCFPIQCSPQGASCCLWDSVLRRHYSIPKRPTGKSPKRRRFLTKRRPICALKSSRWPTILIRNCCRSNRHRSS